MSSRPGVEAATAGALTGVSALAVGELVAGLWPGARSPVAGLGRALIDATPGPAIDVGVALVGERDKPLMAAAMTGGFGLAGAAGALLGRFGPGRAAMVALAPSVVGAGYGLRLPGGRSPGTASAALVAGAVVPLMQARERRPVVAGVVAAVTSAAAVAVRLERRRRDEQARDDVVVPAGTVLPPPAGLTDPRVPGLAPVITPPEDLYQVARALTGDRRLRHLCAARGSVEALNRRRRGRWRGRQLGGTVVWSAGSPAMGAAISLSGLMCR